MKLFYSIYILSFFSSCTLLHKNNFPTPEKITRFPFEMLSGGTVIVKAQFEDFKDSLNFVFDTGSGGISLDSSSVETMGLKGIKTNRTIKGIAGSKKVDFIFKKSLKFPGLQVDSLDFHINNYDILTSSYGIKVDGVIGLSFLRRYVISVNYDERYIEVYTPGKVTYPKGGHLLHPKFYGLPVIPSTIKDNIVSNTDFIFDTGAGLNMLLSEDYVKDSTILKKKRKLYVTQAEGLGGKKMMNTTVVKSIAVGPYKFRSVPIYIFRDDNNITNYPKMGGVLGNDILRRFNIVLNYPSQEIFIKPNTHFFDDFDYSYTGLGLYQINGYIVIEDVVENSPAEKAGLKPNDIIFAVDNNFTNNLQAYKQILQGAGNTVKVVVIRNKELIGVTLEISHIMK
jgi:hypothetical protein